MDPSVFQFSSPSALPQESKLVTYMNRSSSTPVPNSQNIGRISQSSPIANKKINEFTPGTYFTGVDAISSSPKGSPPSPTVPMSASQSSSSNAPQVHQENVGGTTYFYSTNSDSITSTHSQSIGSQQGPVASGTSQPTTYTPPHMYTGTPTHVSSFNSKSGLAASFYMPDVLRAEILQKNQISLSQPDPQSFPELPSSVEQYVDVVPLEMCSVTSGATCYRAAHRQTGQLFALRRLHDFRLASSKCPLLIEKWKKLDHPNLVQLREVFSTKAFGDNSLIFVYDYHPGCVTLMQKIMTSGGSSSESNGHISAYGDPFCTDPDAPRPYTHQKNTILRAAHGGNMLPETTIWSLLVQLTAALRAIHAAGLACRKLDPSKVIMSGYRARISWCGVEEVAGAAGGGGTPPPETEQAQQEDLSALGRMVLAIACRNGRALSPNLVHTYIQLVSRTYSADLKNLILYLLTVSSRRSVTDLMPIIGARFYTQTEALQRRADVLEDQLAMEFDNGRLYRLLVKLATVNERPELNMDGSWAETGDRYMLKLFRDYLFHSVSADGRPWLDHAHLTHCLNQLDCGTENKVQLMSRDEQSVLVVSYAELKHCLEQAFHEVTQAASNH